VEGQTAEVAQGRVSRAEIVDAQAHAQLRDALQQIQGALLVHDEGALRELELEGLRR
jgi:hypothetical protein